MLDDYQWHFDYTRLVRDTGFVLQIHRPRSTIAKNIEHIDIQKVILHQDIELIDKNINTVLEFSLDNEQTSVLDPNFVKIFYISQLSVQYLLFCKKYLDNTVAHLKKEVNTAKEQINNLNSYTEQLQHNAKTARNEIKQLQTTLSCQVASTQDLPVFQCNQCPKAFSTEEYLLAHIQRRHESVVSSTSFQLETDKLQSEIKALKERLNNTEKYIHSDDDRSRNKNIGSIISRNNVENTALTDLQHKFELLKVHVDNELRILQTQKFDQDKYEQWFETFLKKLDCYNSEIQSKHVGGGDGKTINICTVCQTNEASVRSVPYLEEAKIARNDSTTQTDFIEPSNTACKNCEKNDQKQASPHHLSGYYSDKELQPHFQKLGEIIHERVTGSIEKLESQMQTFCNKMNQLEKQNLNVGNKEHVPSPTLQTFKDESKTDVKTLPNTHDEDHVIVIKPAIQEDKVHDELPDLTSLDTVLQSPEIVKDNDETEIKVVPRPRKKWNTNKPIIGEKLTKSAAIPEDIITVEDDYSSINVEEESSEKNDSSKISSGSHSSSEPIVLDRNNKSTITQPKSMPIPTVRKKLTSSSSSLEPEVQRNFQKEVEHLLNQRLTELGVSPDWSAIPNNSYRRSLDIVLHQNNLIKKKYANYRKINQEIIRKVDNEVLNNKKSMKYLSRNKALKTTGVSSIQDAQAKHLQSTVMRNGGKQKQVVKMYESASDTDTDDTLTNRKRMVWGKENVLDQTQKKYFNVIQEFSEKNKQNLSSGIQSIDGDDGKIEQAKSALKNYPSVGSLHKKKVLFNLQSSGTSQDKVQLRTNGGGSTSSIGSSVFDGSKTNLAENSNKKMKVWDISDDELNVK